MEPKYYECQYCKALAFGYMEKCGFCDTPLIIEISEVEFNEKAHRIINKDESIPTPSSTAEDEALHFFESHKQTIEGADYIDKEYFYVFAASLKSSNDVDANYILEKINNWVNGQIKSLESEKEINGKTERIRIRLRIYNEIKIVLTTKKQKGDNK